MRIFNVEGFEIKESWMQNTNYPEPPDNAPLSNDDMKMWDRYRQEVEKFYNKCKSECTCKELEKNNEMCPICDEQDYKKFHDKMNNSFAEFKKEFSSPRQRSKLFYIIHSSISLLTLAKQQDDSDSYDKNSISVKIEEDIIRYFEDKRL